MTDVHACPTPGQLREHFVGELSEDVSVIINEHLSKCDVCQTATQSIVASDTFLNLIRQAGRKPVVVLPARTIGVFTNLRDRVQAEAISNAQSETLISRLDESLAGSKIPSRLIDDELSDLLSRVRPAEAPAELGRLGGFRLIRLLGYGGMGAVFLAEDLQLQRHVALKLVRQGVVGKRDGNERFLREARAAANVRHENVVTIYQVGEENGVPFLAQEFLEGETLEARLSRDHRLSVAESLAITQQIAAGLAAAHARGLVHRDVKPANVFLTVNHHSPGAPATVKLLDFGLARAMSSETQLTQTGMVIGTPAYMSPEQASGESVDHRTDLFSLGCVLYTMLVGERPFRGDNIMKTIASLAKDTPPSVNSVRAEVPLEVSRLIDQLLAKSVDDRPESANNVVSRLADLRLTVLEPTTLLLASEHRDRQIPDPLRGEYNHTRAGIPPSEFEPGTLAAYRETIAVDSPQHGAAVAPIPKRKLGRLVLIALGALSAFVACAAVIAIMTDTGMVEITAEDGVKLDVTVLRNDEPVKKNWQIVPGEQRTRVWAGRVKIELPSEKQDEYEIISPDELLVRRGKTILFVVKRRGAAQDPPSLKPGTNVARELDPGKPIDIQEPPPLEEWLKGRKVLTVAQNGSGQFKTIQAALDALQSGEVVTVLDKGPYRERLSMKSIPPDTGLISEQQTLLVVPEWGFGWKETYPGIGEIGIYLGHHFVRGDGFRLHGFEMQFPDDEGKSCRRLALRTTGVFVLENSAIRSSESYEGSPVDVEFLDGETDTTGHPGKKVFVRECLIEGSLSISARSRTIGAVERNCFIGRGSNHHLAIAGNSIDQIVIRHNVFAGKSEVDVLLLSQDALSEFELSNNTLCSNTGLEVPKTVPNQKVTLRNNVRTQGGLVLFKDGAEREIQKAVERWQVDHNAYVDGPGRASNETILPRSPGDPSAIPQFLSKVSREVDYLRPAAAATTGAGGDWPSYIGALPNGPAPKEGDWFTRMRSQWKLIAAPAAESVPVVAKEFNPGKPIDIPEPPALEEWLKGREVLTVAQDGSGQFKTIQSALLASR